MDIKKTSVKLYVPFAMEHMGKLFCRWITHEEDNKINGIVVKSIAPVRKVGQVLLKIQVEKMRFQTQKYENYQIFKKNLKILFKLLI